MKTRLQIGKLYGKWTPIKSDGVDSKRRVRYICQCSCGREQSVVASAVAAGRTTQCRHCRREDLSGREYGSWLVLEKAPDDKSGRSMWLCRCECGKESPVTSLNLKRGTSTCCFECGHKVAQTRIFPKIFWTKTKAQARERNLAWEITEEYLEELFQKQNGRCALSGVELMFGDNETDRSASLDRIDSHRGYVEGNLQWIFKPLNVMKFNYDQKRFIELCRLVAEHNRN